MMTNTELLAKITADVAICLDKAKILYPDCRNLQVSRISLITNHRVLGTCYRDYGGRARLEFNEDYARQDYEDLLNDTIPHEIAHAIVNYLQYVRLMPQNARPHGLEWRSVARALGCSPRATCKVERFLKTSGKKKIRRFEYLINGEKYMFTTTIHNCIQNGDVRWLRNKEKTRITRDHFTGTVHVLD